ncbi:ABC transporter ATP-binding protein [Deferribacter autotrophicus]|uniref:ABC transporter ATP-binding protein n=1 Tax=Deferribacter autotrophicus TaxID=500465 RepID=A0A5A8F8K6_9BACT|nr:ABC transporter ATP-binding protein [Deferribacter autotrophicus]KAA0258623.1 ABC transporter ATP-binding protein [Deferribacter autotrophicus]
MSCSLHLKNISYIAEDNTLIFENVNLHIKHKDKIAIIGPNGIGKTTLLKIISGLKKPKTGEIYVFDNRIETDDDYEKVRKKIGFLFQNSDDQFIFPTVKDDIAFGLFNLGMKKSEVEKKVKNILDDLEIAHLAEKSPFKLSGGEKKLVALAGILVCEPEILLLDEPTTALDDNAINKIIKILTSLDKTILIVSHNIEFVKKVTFFQYRLKKDGLHHLKT